MRERLETKFVTEHIPDWQLLRSMAYEMPKRPEKQALFAVVRHSVLFKLACYLGHVPLDERMAALDAMLKELQAGGMLLGSTAEATARKLPITTQRKCNR